MADIAVFSKNGETRRVEDGSDEYFKLTADHWNIDEIISGEPEHVAVEPEHVAPIWEGRFADIRAAFVDAGWTFDHVSADNDGTIRSVYFTRFNKPVRSAFDKPDRIRVSDHHLGCNAWGEAQGQNLTADFVLSDYDGDTPASDFAVMAEDDYTRAVAANGYTPSNDEWADELAAAKELLG